MGISWGRVSQSNSIRDIFPLYFLTVTVFEAWGCRLSFAGSQHTKPSLSWGEVFFMALQK